jgi:hypothetical protein
MKTYTKNQLRDMLEPQVRDLFDRLRVKGIGRKNLKYWLSDPDFEGYIQRSGDPGDTLDVGFDFGFISGIARAFDLTVVELLEQTRYLK